MKIQLETHMKTFLSLALAISISVATSDSIAQKAAAEPTSKVVLTSEVEWGALNPARGDKGPQAGNLWGDRAGSGASGFLVKFVGGFSSPPHIHNIAYRAVVISGLIYNGDPNAEVWWMPTGSFWTQPAGEAHITAAEGSNNLVYVEIDEGPYLVFPTKKAFDSGERPVNVDASNIVWLDASNATLINQPAIPATAKGPKIALLWGNPQDDQLNGTLVKLPAEFTGKIRSRSSTFHAVVIQGRPNHRVQGQTDIRSMEPGSYFSSKEEVAHQVSCETNEDCIIYVRTKGKFEVIPG